MPRSHAVTGRKPSHFPAAVRALGPALVFVLLAGCTPLRALTRHQDRQFADVAPGVWRLDPQHWSVSFDVDHLGFSRFVMRFDRAGAVLRWPKAGAAGAPAASLQAWVESASVDTNDSALDAELRGPAMLDARRQPRITLQADGLRDLRGDRAVLRGVLRLGEHREPVLLHLRLRGYGVNPIDGLPTLGVSARGEFSRERLGLPAWPGLVGDTVRLHIEAEFTHQR